MASAIANSGILTAEEKAAKGIAPVKLGHVFKAAQRVIVDVVGGSDSQPAGAAGDGGAKDGKAGGLTRKSKKQLKREAREQRAARVCSAYVSGTCHFGDGCRFSHDLEAYLATKPKELPGTCPFNLLERCPYGINCMWASTHTNRDEPTLQYVINRKRHPQGAHASPCGRPCSAPAAAAAPHSIAAAAEHGTSTIQDAPCNDQTAAAAATQVAAAAATPCAAVGSDNQSAALAFNESPVAATPGAELSTKVQATAAMAAGPVAPAERLTAPAAGVAPAAGRYVGDGTIPGPGCVLHLPLPASIQPPVNGMSKDLQTLLRKNQYDFGRANTVLESLGVPVRSSSSKGQHGKAAATHLPVGPAASKGLEGVQTGRAASQAGNAAQTPGGAAQGCGDAAQGCADASCQAPGADEPPSKRARLDADSSSAGTGAKGGGMGATVHKPQGAGAGPSLPEEPLRIFDVAHSRSAFVDSRVTDRERAAAKQRRSVDFCGKSYLAPLTTVGNLPFRRLCKGLGCDITCGEMALATNLLQGQASEWALLKRHPSEDCFGVQVCGGYPDAMARVAQLIEDSCEVDFVDINCGCPIDLICEKGAGSSLMTRPRQLEHIVRSMSTILSCPLTFKIRKGYYDDRPLAHTIVPCAADWGAAAVAVHGRTRQQRYTKLADWDYIKECASLSKVQGVPLLGNGDVMSYREFEEAMEQSGVATTLIARGALVKPWLFTEIKERRDWDISAGERLDLLKQFVSYGLEQWGADTRGVEATRRFLLEWLSFTHRYIPVGLLEMLPQRLHWRPPPLLGRSDLETLLASDNARDWVRISQMLLGPTPPGFTFSPKHKSNAYATSDGDLGAAYQLEK